MTWFDAVGLRSLAQRHKCIVLRQIRDFREWITGTLSFEFSPHHLLCGFRGTGLKHLVETDRSASLDIDVIGSLAQTVMAQVAPEQARKLAIGLFNTHFSELPSDGSVDSTLVQDFLYLIHASLRLDLPARSLPATAALYHAAATAAMVDAPRGLSREQVNASRLARFLATNTVRF